MNVRHEIKTFSAKPDRPILAWLFDRYHMQSQWRFVAKSKFVQYGRLSYEANRVWSPTDEGVALYRYFTIYKPKEDKGGLL